MPAPGLILTLLLTACFTLATWLQPVAANWNKSRAQSDNLLSITLGDARRLFANHFFVEADVYFHSSYYPTIFDQQASPDETPDVAEETHHDPHEKPSEEIEEDFLGKPRDWVEKFGRNFFVTKHTHLAGAAVREILPWLQLSAELDPERVETYTVTSYWLRTRLNKPHEAEQFLRDGLRANPDSHEILFELGRLYFDNLHDLARARNVWELADKKLAAQEKATGGFDLGETRQILAGLEQIEETEGHLPEAIHYLERLRDAMPPELANRKVEFQKQIDELKQKIAAPTAK